MQSIMTKDVHKLFSQGHCAAWFVHAVTRAGSLLSKKGLHLQQINSRQAKHLYQLWEPISETERMSGVMVVIVCPQPVWKEALLWTKSKCWSCYR